MPEVGGGSALGTARRDGHVKFKPARRPRNHSDPTRRAQPPNRALRSHRPRWPDCSFHSLCNFRVMCEPRRAEAGRSIRIARCHLRYSAGAPPSRLRVHEVRPRLRTGCERGAYRAEDRRGEHHGIARRHRGGTPVATRPAAPARTGRCARRGRARARGGERGAPQATRRPRRLRRSTPGRPGPPRSALRRRGSRARRTSRSRRTVSSPTSRPPAPTRSPPSRATRRPGSSRSSGTPAAATPTGRSPAARTACPDSSTRLA